MPEKQTNRERLKEITDSIEQGIQELFQSEKYQQYLRTMTVEASQRQWQENTRQKELAELKRLKEKYEGVGTEGGAE